MKKMIFASVVGLALVGFTGCMSGMMGGKCAGSSKCEASGKCASSGKCSGSTSSAKKCASSGKCGTN